MWTATVTKVEADPDAKVAKVTMVFSNGAGKDITMVHRISEPSAIKDIARQYVNEYTRQDMIDAFIASPTLGVVDLSTPAPTPEETAQEVYARKKMELEQAKRDLELKLISQAAYDLKLAEVLAAKR